MGGEVTPIPDKKENNPSTNDNLMFYITILSLSIIGYAVIGIYIKKVFN